MIGCLGKANSALHQTETYSEKQKNEAANLVYQNRDEPVVVQKKCMGYTLSGIDAIHFAHTILGDAS